MQKRPVDVAVISDLHLGTYACRAKEFVSYLNSIEPRLLILNGDIIDGWQFSKHYFPLHHITAIQQIFHLLSNGTRVIYITGNHDETLRRYADLHLGNFQLADKVVIEIDGKMNWIFHGDVFDHTTANQAKFWGKLGSNGYAMLLGFNKMINKMMRLLGREKVSLSKKIMEQFHKRFVRIDAFETMIAELAIEKKYDCVICGHIHQPVKRVYSNEKGAVTYLNSGDWVEHMTSLEYYNNDWHLYTHQQEETQPEPAKQPKPKPEVITNEIAIYLHSLTQPSAI
ncbi:MAG: UDP-2,3-diacylglucosamine diphosphatase [Chitinophagaceae bacterium]|jgi:UDP-2,3-diacylglucosamine pyrophosphatase LpxH|nr:UDP-2,3-diacylglucosamine diphosphatase [Sphingobacteriales bacterium]OJW02939.1 MAG: UDP-2,3-diacylglucosamine hydrolase [Sphingobacteriales bacterium 44-61]TXJ27298.1 MAG: UDP-2,3-diacylglucosamine diphosphatase [Chitinophagaceae bacterium]